GWSELAGTVASWPLPSDAQIAPPTNSRENGVKLTFLTCTGAPPCSGIRSRPFLTASQMAPPATTTRNGAGLSANGIGEPTGVAPPGSRRCTCPPLAVLLTSHRAPSPAARLRALSVTGTAAVLGVLRSTTLLSR